MQGRQSPFEVNYESLNELGRRILLNAEATVQISDANEAIT